MRVLFVRHAAAEDRASSGSDLDRRLTDEGRDDARAMFTSLSKLYPQPNLIISSKARRARETAKIFSLCFGKTEVIESDQLNPGCGFKEFRTLMGGLAGRELVVFVGHEPDFSNILGQIIGDGGLRIDVKKASCIEVDINSICKGELKLVLTPKAVAKLAR